jgi:EmrB/QacA subfamily drug resistance transporter
LISAFTRPPCDDAIIHAAPAVPDCERHTGRWVLIATILGSSMAFIDGTVVNVALPVMQRELGATVADVQWIVEAYALFLSALILVGGSLGDHFGRRRVFTSGVVVFALASVVCGLAPTVGVLIVARAVQGVGGALLTPGSLAIISATFSPAQRGRAIGTWSGFTTITTALGPVLGGWLVQNATWRWVFFINVPFAVAVVAVTLLHVPESRDPTAARLDRPGALLVTLGLGGLVFGLINSSSFGFGSPLVIVALALGAACLVGFVVVERDSPAPMMPLSLFRSRTFSGANLLTLLLYAALGASTFFVPFNLIQVQGYSPAAAGAAFLPFIVIVFALSRWAGGLVTRYGAKLPLVVGPTVAGIGLALFAAQGIGGSYWTTFFPAVCVLGLGMAITIAPLTTTVMGAVASDHAGIASGINNAVARTASLLAIAVFGIVILAAFNVALNANLTPLHLTPAVQAAIDAQRTRLAGAQIPSGVSHTLLTALKQAIDEAYIAGFRVVMLCGAALALASAVSAWVLIEGKPVGASAPAPGAAGAVGTLGKAGAS